MANEPRNPWEGETLRELASEVIAALEGSGIRYLCAPVTSIPVVAATVLSASYLDGCIVRDADKLHGTRCRIENPPPPGAKVAVVGEGNEETRDAIAALEQAGYEIERVINSGTLG
jgi:orotate phosphoribosyltransferase